MAGTRHFAEFADEGGNVWRINIHDADLPGAYTATEFKVGSEGFVLSYQGNNEQQHQPVIGSSVEFTMFEETTAHTQTLDLFYSNPEGRMQLEIYKDPDGVNSLYWRGVILAEQVVRNDEAKPTAVLITASDDLGNLKDIEFDLTLGGLGSALYVKNHLIRCLSGLRTSGLWTSGVPFLRYVNDAEGYHATLSSSDPIADMTATVPVIIEDDGTETKYSCFDILSGLATALNARVFLSEGVFYFYPMNAYVRISDGEGVGTSIKQYDIDAASVTWGSANYIDWNGRMKAISGTTYKKLAGHTFSHIPPAKSVTRTRVFNGNMFVDAGNDNTVITSGWNVSLEDNGRTYPIGSRFRVSGFVEFQVSPDATYTFASDAARVHVEVETILQCGSQFYKPETWSTNSANRYVVDVRTFDRSQGVNMSTVYSWITDDLPSEQSNLDASLVVKFFDQEGTNVTADFIGEDFYLDARIEVIDDNGANSDEITYRSTSSDDNVVEVNQGECIFGDPIAVSAQGKLRPYISGVGYVDGAWKSSQTAGPVALHRLGVDEALSRQRYATKIHSGTIYGTVLEMWMSMVEDSDYYVPFQISTVMARQETTVERFKIAWDSSGITSADDNPRSTGTRGSTLDMVAITANTMTAQVQQPKPTVGVVPDDFTAGRSMQTATDIGPLYTRVTTISHTSGSTTTFAADAYGFAYMNTYTDSATGFGTVYLPKVADSEGRTYKFDTDQTITSTKYVKIGVDASEYTNGVRIDGAQSFAMDRSYDGIEVVCIGGTWFVTDRKDKDGGAISVQYHGRYDSEAGTERSGATANVEIYYTARPDGDGYAESETSDSGVTDTVNRTLYYSTTFQADPDVPGDWTQYTTQPADNATFATAKSALLAGLNATDGTAQTRGTLPLSLKMVRTTTPTVQLLLDTYPADAAYSVRKLSSTYTGYCMKVRRSSDDAEADIGFDTNGVVDSAAIASHCGSSTGFCSVWYDQSGGGLNLAQTTTTNQPQVYDGSAVLTVNSIAALDFDGSADHMKTSGSLTINSQRCDFGVVTPTLGTAHAVVLTTDNVAVFGNRKAQNIRVQSTGQVRTIGFDTSLNVYGLSGSSSISTGSQSLINTQLSGTTLEIFLNGSSDGTMTQPSQITGTSPIGVGVGYNLANPFDGRIQEIVMYQSDEDTNRANITSNINTYFSVY